MKTLTTMEQFTGLSAVLTGFGESVITPLLDPVDIKQLYLTEWQSEIQSETGNADLTATILSTFQSLKDQSPTLTDQQIGEQILANSEFELPCRKLIFLWYMGAWPTLMSGDNATGGSTSFETLSSDSYTSGLVWKVMQSHPMGDSNYRYGYWGDKPADLSDYVGTAPTGENA